MPEESLERCSYLGPGCETEFTPPPDYHSDPFKYLPREIIQSAEEQELASKYGGDMDFSIYQAAQAAYLRRSPTIERNQERRSRFAELKAQVEALGYQLPSNFVTLIESDSFIGRLRHGNIWPILPEMLEPLPSHPDQLMFLMFEESQGCGYWHLLLRKDGGHTVAVSEHSFGIPLNKLYWKDPPHISTFPVFQCAESFEEWIVFYFSECEESDRLYERILKEGGYL